MKELKIKKGRPLLNHILTTSERYTAEELAEAHGGIIVANKINQLKPYQKIVSISQQVINRNLGFEIGQMVMINIDRYGVSKQKKNSVQSDYDEVYDAVVEYRVPIIEVDGKECLKLGDGDIEFIVDEYEFEEVKSSPIIQQDNDIIVPKSNIIL